MPLSAPSVSEILTLSLFMAVVGAIATALQGMTLRAAAKPWWWAAASVASFVLCGVLAMPFDFFLRQLIPEAAARIITVAMCAAGIGFVQAASLCLLRRR